MLLNVDKFWIRDDKLVAAIIHCVNNLSLLFIYETNLYGVTVETLRRYPNITQLNKQFDIRAYILLSEITMHKDIRMNNSYNKSHNGCDMDLGYYDMTDLNIDLKSTEYSEFDVDDYDLNSAHITDYTRFPNEDNLLEVQILQTDTETLISKHQISTTFSKDATTIPCAKCSLHLSHMPEYKNIKCISISKYK